MRFRIAVLSLISLAVMGAAVPVSAQDGARLGPFLSLLAERDGDSGEAAAVALAEAHGMSLRTGPGGALVPVILEPEAGGTPGDIDAAAVRSRGGQVDAVSASFARALVPTGRLAELEGLPGVSVARAPTVAVADAIGLGANVSESALLTGAGTLHLDGVIGTGSEVAVVDLGFVGLASAIAAGELPSGTTGVDFTGTGLEADTVHGVGVAEHVADMAPGATIHCLKIGDEVDLQNAAAYVRDNGIPIANHSVGWVLASYYDDTGPINAIINASRDTDGVLWAVSAGNSADRHWRGGWSDGDGDGWLSFAGSDEGLDLTSSSTVAQVFLNWDQYGNSVTDLDLYVADRRGRLIAASTIDQESNPALDPAEALAFLYSFGRAPYRVMVDHWSGPTAGLDMTIFSFNNNLQHAVAASSLMDPADAHGAYSVAAIDQADWNLADPPPEPYSSQGPTNDGRPKPDITAPDGTTSLTYGSEGSFGTSFSSPTTAGAAALLLELFPGSTADQLADMLSTLAVDIGAAGPDSVHGAGQLDLGTGPLPNQPPTADDQSVSTTENTAVDITLTASDPDSDPLTYSVLTQPANGTLSGTAPDLTYTPDGGHTGPDALTFVANDGEFDSNEATVSITVETQGAETVSILRAEYHSKRDRLTVWATSSDQPSVNLTATITVGGVEQAHAMPFVSKRGRYELVLTNLAQPNPPTVTVESTGGASATAALVIK